MSGVGVRVTVGRAACVSGRRAAGGFQCYLIHILEAKLAVWVELDDGDLALHYASILDGRWQQTALLPNRLRERLHLL